MTLLPLITVMIPTYNQLAFLPVAIESALHQDYQNLEVLVADDLSSDETNSILNNYSGDKRFRYIKNERNLGRVGNYKSTLENHARGDWVVNLDADDYFTDNTFLSKSMNLIMETRDPEIVFLQAGHTVKNKHGQVLRVDLPTIDQDVKVISGIEYFLEFNHFSHLASLYNRSKALSIDFYRYDILSADMESFLRLALHGKVILLRQSIGVWLHHGDNDSQKLNIRTVETNLLRLKGPYLYARALNIITPKKLAGWYKKRVNEYLLNYLIISMTSGDSRLRGFLKHIITNHPKAVFSSVIPKAMLLSTIVSVKKILAFGKGSKNVDN